LQYCSGADAAIIATTKCTIPSIVLHVNAFQLPWSSNVHVKVFATNLYGDSQTSEVGNGAIIVHYPDQPTTLTENFADRTVSSVGFTWLDGADNGGLPVIDYRVKVTSSDQSFSLVVNGLTSQRYTQTGLTLGITYLFTVESRNSHGFSNSTAAFGILCAVKPLVPTELVTVNSNDNVIFRWKAPSDQGSPITAYRVQI